MGSTLNPYLWKIHIWDPITFQYRYEHQELDKEFQTMVRYGWGGRYYMAVLVNNVGPFREAYFVDCEDMATYCRGEIPVVGNAIH